MHGIETELRRPVYGLAENLFRALPVRRHAVVARRRRARAPRQRVPAAARRAAARARVPRGHQGHRQARAATATSSAASAAAASSRSRCARACPIVPIAVVGNEEAMPILWKSPRLAKLLGLPYFPVTANNFVFGPLLGYVLPLPAKFRIRVLPPVTFDVAPGPGALQPQHGDGGGRAHPRRSIQYGALRHAAQPPQRLARAEAPACASSSPGSARSGAAASRRPRDSSPTSSCSSASTPASRGSRSSAPSSCAPTRRTTILRPHRARHPDRHDPAHPPRSSTPPQRERATLHEINVIGTMNLLAAAGAAGSPVRKFVLKSSTLSTARTSPTPTSSARTQRAHASAAHTGRAVAGRGRRRSSRDFAEDNPHIVVTKLGSPTCSATTSTTVFSRLLRLPVVPEIFGFDPRLQFVHEDDVTGALAYATLARRTRRVQRRRRRAPIPWSEVCRSRGKRRSRLPPVVTGAAAVPLRLLARRRPAARAAEPAAVRAWRRHQRVRRHRLRVPLHHAGDGRRVRQGASPRTCRGHPARVRVRARRRGLLPPLPRRGAARGLREEFRLELLAAFVPLLAGDRVADVVLPHAADLQEARARCPRRAARACRRRGGCSSLRGTIAASSRCRPSSSKPYRMTTPRPRARSRGPRSAASIQ